MNEDSIRPDSLRPDLAAAAQRDMEWLLAHRSEFVRMGCPVCSPSEGATLWYMRDGFWYYRCTGCGTVYVDPRPPQALLDEYYYRSEVAQCWCGEIYPASEDVRRNDLCKVRLGQIGTICWRLSVPGWSGWFSKSAIPLVDIGAGYGTFAAVARTLFTDVIAIEPSPQLASACARREGIDTRACSLDRANLESESASVVTAFEVIEHVSSPEQFLRTCYRLLVPGGLLVLTCPNADGFDVQALGTASSTISHEHLTYFTPESLPALLEAVGFEVVEVDTPGKLDLELVHKAVVAGAIVTPWIKYLVVDRWGKIDRQAVQQCLADNLLSSHLWVVARKPPEEE